MYTKLVLSIDGIDYEKIQILLLKIEKKFKNTNIRRQRRQPH